jgi:hypothetical protein
VPLYAAPCRCSQSRRRKYALFLGTLALSQAEGRRFEPGLALQQTTFHFRKFFSNGASFALPPRLQPVRCGVWLGVIAISVKKNS